MKIISNQINPHFNFLEALQAVGQIFSTKKTDLSQYIGTNNFLLTNTARTALGLIADTINPQKKIALPAFICAVVATPFLERGHEIEWIDVDANGLMSVSDFEKKSDKIDLVIVPHIFGQPAPLKEIYAIAKKKNIFVVEDGAHLMTKNFNYCDAKIWSFGREKVVSCVSGGALLWPESSNKFDHLALKSPRLIWQVRHALQPLVFAVTQPWWHLGGKLIPGILRKLNFLPLAVTQAERNGQEDIPIRALGGIQQRILLQQWKKHHSRTLRAQDLAKTWETVLPKNLKTIIPESAFRVIVKFKSLEERQSFVASYFAKKTWHLRDWDGVPISPASIKLSRFGYKIGQCPGAEKYAQTYLTLPTNTWCTEKDLKRLEKPPSRSKMNQI